MEFGRVDTNELNNVDFSLPEEPDFNKKVLKGKLAKNPKVYLGCAKWGRVEWVGKIYPPKTKEKDFLQHYVEHYNSIELTPHIIKSMVKQAFENGRKKQKERTLFFAPRCIKVLLTLVV